MNRSHLPVGSCLLALLIFGALFWPPAVNSQTNAEDITCVDGSGEYKLSWTRCGLPRIPVASAVRFLTFTTAESSTISNGLAERYLVGSMQRSTMQSPILL